MSHLMGGFKLDDDGPDEVETDKPAEVQNHYGSTASFAIKETFDKI